MWCLVREVQNGRYRMRSRPATPTYADRALPRRQRTMQSPQRRVEQDECVPCFSRSKTEQFQKCRTFINHTPLKCEAYNITRSRSGDVGAAMSASDEVTSSVSSGAGRADERTRSVMRRHEWCANRIPMRETAYAPTDNAQGNVPNVCAVVDDDVSTQASSRPRVKCLQRSLTARHP